VSLKREVGEGNMERELSLFERVIYEAPGDPPPDIPAEEPTSDAPPDTGGGDPPDLPAASGGDPGGDMSGSDPPELGEDFGDEEGFGDIGSEEEVPEDLGLDEKISAIMNQNLYQRFLSLLNSVGNQLSMIKNNNDVLFTISNDSLDIVSSLKKLDENIRAYLANYFLNENYSKNLLFFNKCLNLLKLLNDIFGKNIQKGMKAME